MNTHLIPFPRRLQHAHAPSGRSTRAPLRRSLPSPARARISTTWLVIGGALVLFDIEFGLAYLLHFAAALFD